MRLRVLLLVLVAACGTRLPVSDAPPRIVVREGLEARLALMDRYRLHDEERHLMTARPRVWVEEVPAAEAADGEAPPQE